MAIRKPQQCQGAVNIANAKPLPSSWVSIDMETTGFDPELDRIIEIGAVRFTEGEPVAMFNTMVRQLDINALSPEIIAATGHTYEDVQKGMSEEQAIGILYQFLGDGDKARFALGGNTLVGHNVLFDFSFFTKAMERLHCYPPMYNLIDTLTIARDRYPYPHKLPDMCKKLDVQQGSWHSAYFDALACGELLLAMDKLKGVGDYLNVIGWKRQYGLPKWSPDWVTMKPQGNITVQEGPNVRSGGSSPSVQT